MRKGRQESQSDKRGYGGSGGSVWEKVKGGSSIINKTECLGTDELAMNTKP